MIGDLVGKELKKIIVKDDRLIFITTSYKRYLMHHEQDCCESVYVDDISGDLDDLINTPIIDAREDSNNALTPEDDESYTWTFYNFRTIKGSVTIKWYGTSNGYYSESVDFKSVPPMPKWIKALYTHGTKQDPGNIRLAILDDAESCFVKDFNKEENKILYKQNIQELINTLHNSLSSKPKDV